MMVTHQVVIEYGDVDEDWLGEQVISLAHWFELRAIFPLDALKVMGALIGFIDDRTAFDFDMDDF